ncbi:hypothetical protein DENSPDRAFT_449173 [Dentipellis sp. KUC8613]|nr:hypothetical protein DENSPDRAFT_449173 [Dentipellis sp. KUC8613]
MCVRRAAPARARVGLPVNVAVEVRGAGRRGLALESLLFSAACCSLESPAVFLFGSLQDRQTPGFPAPRARGGLPLALRSRAPPPRAAHVPAAYALCGVCTCKRAPGTSTLPR